MTDPAPPWQRYPYHRPTSALRFPDDEGWHRLLPHPFRDRGLANPSLKEMEWVYLNTHLTETGGARRRFVVFAAYFTQHLRFLVVRAWDAQERYLGAWTGSTLGALTAVEGRHDVSFEHPGGTDSWRTVHRPGGRLSELEPFHSRLVAHDDAGAFSVDLDLVNTKTPYEAGGVGYLPFSWDGWFNYYSLTRLRVSGALTPMPVS